MKCFRRFYSLIQFSAAIWLALSPESAFAYDHPLDDRAIQDAYSIGQDLKTVNTFLSPYAQGLPAPRTGPHVAEIQLNTPFAQTVEVSAQHSVGYSSQQAEEDYLKRGDSIVVRVKVLFTTAYHGRPFDFWRGVSVGLIQKQHMAATSFDAQPIYSSNPDGGTSLAGAYVFAHFSTGGVASEPVQVEVIPPEGPPVHATFDLKKLR